MEQIEAQETDIESITDEINALRRMLDELCYELDKNINRDYILKISQELDILIVEYMNKVKLRNNI